jgi:hypothetical protein
MMSTAHSSDEPDPSNDRPLHQGDASSGGTTPSQFPQSAGDAVPAPESDDYGFVYELRGSAPLDEVQRAALARFAVTQMPSSAQLADGALKVLTQLGEGAAVVEASGEITWLNPGLAAQSPEIMRRFADSFCRIKVQNLQTVDARIDYAQVDFAITVDISGNDIGRIGVISVRFEGGNLLQF